MAQVYRTFSKGGSEKQIKCENCGRMFAPSRPHFKTCYSCHAKQQERASLPADLLLRNYYDNNNNLVKEVFIGIPKQIADILARDELTIKQLRDFHSQVLDARNKSILKGIDCARPVLWECQKNLAYQSGRRKVPKTFVSFIEHHISIAEESGQNLEGFYQHLDSVLCYFPRERRG